MTGCLEGLKERGGIRPRKSFLVYLLAVAVSLPAARGLPHLIWSPHCSKVFSHPGRRCISNPSQAGPEAAGLTPSCGSELTETWGASHWIEVSDTGMSDRVCGRAPSKVGCSTCLAVNHASLPNFPGLRWWSCWSRQHRTADHSSLHSRVCGVHIVCVHKWCVCVCVVSPECGTSEHALQWSVYFQSNREKGMSIFVVWVLAQGRNKS